MDDKKKMMIVGSLVAVLLAVGAFQLLAPAPKPAIAPEPDKTSVVAQSGNPADPDAEVKDPVRAKLESLLNEGVSVRDPFVPTGDIPAEALAPISKIAPPSADPTRQERPAAGRRSTGSSWDGGAAPWNPLPGSLPAAGGGVVPTGGGMSGQIGAGGGPTPGENTGGSSYKVKGTIVGNTKMAVFEDDKGNQKLVPLGGSVDGDTKVVGISNGKVKVRRGGRTEEVGVQPEDRR